MKVDILRLSVNKAAPVNDIIPLSLLSSGERALVHAVFGLPEQIRRLQELGFREGAPIEMVRSGSPCIVRLDDSKICFRECELTSILVRSGISA